MSLHGPCAWIWMGKFRHVHYQVSQLRFFEEFIASSSSFVNHKICIREKSPAASGRALTRKLSFYGGNLSPTP